MLPSRRPGPANAPTLGFESGPKQSDTAVRNGEGRNYRQLINSTAHRVAILWRSCLWCPPSPNDPLSGQVVIAWSNNDLCNKYSADDSESLLYRIVKRLHIIVHILRCGTGLYVPHNPHSPLVARPFHGLLSHLLIFMLKTSYPSSLFLSLRVLKILYVKTAPPFLVEADLDLEILHWQAEVQKAHF